MFHDGRIRKLVKSKSHTLRYIRGYSESTYVPGSEQRTGNLPRGAPIGTFSTRKSENHSQLESKLRK